MPVAVSVKWNFIFFKEFISIFCISRRDIVYILIAGIFRYQAKCIVCQRITLRIKCDKLYLAFMRRSFSIKETDIPAGFFGKIFSENRFDTE
jgi:hypothetical protein